jgi:hypothetical protein
MAANVQDRCSTPAAGAVSFSSPSRRSSLRGMPASGRSRHKIPGRPRRCRASERRPQENALGRRGRHRACRTPPIWATSSQPNGTLTPGLRPGRFSGPGATTVPQKKSNGS